MLYQATLWPDIGGQSRGDTNYGLDFKPIPKAVPIGLLNGLDMRYE